MHTIFDKQYKVGLGLFLALALVCTHTPPPVMGQAGGTFTNGTSTFPEFTVPAAPESPPLMVPGFLFEPEFPLNSLKTVPIWNELEQLLDNPYNVTLCSLLPTTVDALVRNTPGTTQITGSPVTPIWPAYCTTSAVVRRPGFGVTLPPLLVHPLNYNPTDGEEMRLLNQGYSGGNWIVPDKLYQCSQTRSLPGNSPVRSQCALRLFSPNVWMWSYKSVVVTNGASRVSEAEIDYNAPIRPDVANNALLATFNSAAGAGTNGGRLIATGLLNTPLTSDNCVVTTEVFPPEGDTMCGGDPGEPGYAGFGVLRPTSGTPNRTTQYSTPAVPGGTTSLRCVVNDTSTTSCSTLGASCGTGGSGRCALIVSTPATAQLFDPSGRGPIGPRTPAGAGGLKKPSIRIAPYSADGTPNYLANTDPAEVAPSNENDYVRDRNVAAALGKALFWDMQVGSDAVQSCGSCHAHAGADNRTKNQLNPNHLSGDNNFEVQPPNGELVASDFPFQKLTNADTAGDPKCTTAITASVNAGVLENNPGAVTVCNAGNVKSDKNNAGGTKVANDVASSMGVHFGRFLDIPPIGLFGPPDAVGGVRSVLPDLRSPLLADNTDPIPGFQGTDGSGHGIRRVEPRNTPTIFAAALNFDNFWDGRARHDFNGGSVFGAADPQSHVFVDQGGTLTATRQIIRFASIASLATGPGLSEFEMSFQGRNWAKIGKKLLQAEVTPLANQLVDPNDSVLGPYSNQPGNPSPSPLCTGTRAVGKPGLCTSYNSLIQAAFYPALHTNTSQHLNGCYTDGNATLHPNQCASVAIPVLDTTPNSPTFGKVVNSSTDPFDGYILTLTDGTAGVTDTNQFTQMEGNFSLFWGLSIHLWVTILMPDNTPFDQFMDKNPDAFEAIGEAGEPGLVGPLPVCTSATQRHCFREVGNFKRDSSFANNDVNNCRFPASGEGNTTLVTVAPCKGTRNPGSNAPDPLLGMDIFQGSNLSLKNPNFRAARCGECHAGGTLTDNTTPFTFKAQLGDFIGEFLSKGNEALIEPLGRTRVITGFLLESEFNENGQDAVERRIANQSIVPCPTDGLAYPGGLEPGSGQGFGVCGGAGQAFFDNGVYNLGVTRCEADQSTVTGVCDDLGRGGPDAFGWPLSLAALLLKNLGGTDQEPGVALTTFNPASGPGGGLFEETSQDQQINPGEEGEPVDPLLPDYLAPWANQINVGDSMPELDEVHGGINTLTDVAILEGFIDNIGPFNPAGVLNESFNNGDNPQGEMGTWPMVNRVGRFGSFKAPQLREVELTGPYFHNGGKLTLRQVVDFYVRGGDFPITNAMHRDFNMINQNIEVQSNLKEEEKVALVDFLLELTDDRVRFEREPFDHPQVIIPLDGTAPENGDFAGLALRDAALANCVASSLGPGQQACMPDSSGSLMFLDVPAVGKAGNTAPLPNFLGISSGPRLVGAAANCGAAANNHYCR
jgi:cytochrome c peroxidase